MYAFIAPVTDHTASTKPTIVITMLVAVRVRACEAPCRSEVACAG